MLARIDFVPALTFVRVLDFVGAHLGIRTFLLAPYQLGRGNAEAVDSGAFWFYAKLGFVPARSDLARLARAERRRFSRARGARSPAETLARLAEGRMALTVRGRREAAVTAFDASRLTRRVAASGAADLPRRADGERLLGAGALRLSPAERAAFRGLAPILAAIPGLAGWPRADRARLLAVIRAKAGPAEGRYLRQLRGHPRLRAALLRLGAAEDGPACDCTSSLNSVGSHSTAYAPRTRGTRIMEHYSECCFPSLSRRCRPASKPGAQTGRWLRPPRWVSPRDGRRVPR